MKEFTKSKLSAEDIHFDESRDSSIVAIPQSDGSYRSGEKINASHIPILAAANLLKLYNNGDFTATNMQEGLEQIIASLNSIFTFPNQEALEQITTAGSGHIITTAERQKLNSITDLGSGKIISDAERSKLLNLDSENTGASTAYVDQEVAGAKVYADILNADKATVTQMNTAINSATSALNVVAFSGLKYTAYYDEGSYSVGDKGASAMLNAIQAVPTNGFLVRVERHGGYDAGDDDYRTRAVYRTWSYT